ncbi:MAG TPA: DUF6531 domain-containing protein [Candidatus Tumulicola sp.]|nr:DUF6531 domain-containing protein [Candidatus Tumulicola sp.]
MLQQIRPRPQSGALQSIRPQPVATASSKPISGVRPQSMLRLMTVDTTGPNSTGINHWWEYEEGGIGGVGKYMVNVASGNLIVQSDDMGVPNKGIEFAFRRTYNSMSNHTYANADGSIPSNYGDGFTNTFDAHIAFNNGAPAGISVYDIDGARYDYAPDGHGNWIAPLGQHAKLVYDGNPNGQGGYFWVKKSGTMYYFYYPALTGSTAAYSGRLVEIFGRNYNNYLTFTYAWDGGDASTSAKLNQITVTAEDGRTAKLTFANFCDANGQNCARLLYTLTWPDNTTAVTYSYQISSDASHSPILTQVSGPGNNVAASLPEQYSYLPGHQLQWVMGPRYVRSGGTDGGAAVFSYNGSKTSAINLYANVDLQINDGYSTAQLQAGHPASPYYFYTDSFTYGTGNTVIADTDGHQVTYNYDSSDRVTSRTDFTGDPSGGVPSLSTTQTWDANNNLIVTVDPRGDETDVAYDANGNPIAIAAPSASTNVNGTQVNMRATSLYSYNTNNNVTASCDPVDVHTKGLDWTTRPASSDSLCPSDTGATRYTWTAQSYEPNGQLTSTLKPATVAAPSGYQTTFAYAVAPQGGADYGLPTTVTGASFTQNDGSLRAPAASLVYDAHGNVTSYSKGVGSWSLAYDALNRLIAATDPDNVTSYKYYYANGQVQRTETAFQHSNATGVVYTFDADRNEITEMHRFGGTSGTTTKYYDGADRLVEVALPQGQSDFYAFSWLTRYLYDLTQNQGTVSLGMNAPSWGTATYNAHGNLFAVQEYLVDPIQEAGQPATGVQSWTDTKGTAYDALDRPVAGYTYVPGVSMTAQSTTYDATSLTRGLVTSSTTGTGVTSTPTYDLLGRVTAANFSGGEALYTPSMQTTYDPDGRVASINSSFVGTQRYTYDAVGRRLTSTDPAGGTGMPGFSGSGTLTSPATMTYGYYPDGSRSTLSVGGASSALQQSNLFAYSYRPDGLLSQEKFNYGSVAYAFSSTFTNAGRLQTTSDPLRTNATSRSYDSYGRLASYAIPAGTYTGYTYDPEGDITSTTVSASISGGTTFSHSYNTRGEVVDTTKSANGYAYPTQAPRITPAFDARPATSIGANWNATPPPPPDPGICDGNPYAKSNGLTVQTVNYDESGRQTSQLSSQLQTSCDGTTKGGIGQGSGPNRSYDAMNHHVGYSTGILNRALNDRTEWGPNGHPIMAGLSPLTSSTAPPTYRTETLHWDGGTPLFTTRTSFGITIVDDIKIGHAADYLPADSGHAGLTVWDRDAKGQIASSRNSTGTGSWYFPDPNHGFANAPVLLATPTSGFAAPFFPWNSTACPPNGKSICDTNLQTANQIYEPSTDSISDGAVMIQGVRSYDPSVGAWTAPDALAGVTDDPMSQKPYSYDRNNPVGYSDPTGFMPTVMAIQGGSFAKGDLQGQIESDDSDHWALVKEDYREHKNGDYDYKDTAAYAADQKAPCKIEGCGEPEYGANIWQRIDPATGKLLQKFGYGGKNGEYDTGSTDAIGGYTSINVDNIPDNTRLVGYWHSHIEGGKGLAFHAEMLAALHAAGFDITLYTSRFGRIEMQTWDHLDPTILCNWPCSGVY